MGVHLQLPPASAIVVQIVVLPSLTTTLAFGSLVPTSAGVLLFDTIAFWAGCEIAGAEGAVVSTVKLRVVAGPMLPAGSVCVTLRMCGPSASAVVGVQLQFPLTSTVAVHSVFGPSLTVMVAPGSPVPPIVGWVLGETLAAAGVLTIGATGACVSTVKLRVVAGLTLPPASVAVALIVCAPSAIGRLGVQLQLPLVSVVAVHRSTPFSVTLTVLFGSALPLMAGVLSLVLLLAAGVLITGVPGDSESTVKLSGDVVVEPPGSVTLATTVVKPSDKTVVGVQFQLPLASTVPVHSTVPVGEVVTVT